MAPVQKIFSVILMSAGVLVAGSYSQPLQSAEVSSDFVHEVYSNSNSNHRCAIVGPNRDLYCWGLGTAGQLGVGSWQSEFTPKKVVGITNVQSASVGATHTCAIVGVERTVFCWGYGAAGALGNGKSGDQADESIPKPVLGMTEVLKVEAGTDVTCAIKEAGEQNLYCWGFSKYVTIVPGKDFVLEPTLIPKLGRVASVSMGAAFICVRLFEKGELACWGNSNWGQAGTLEYQTNEPRLVPNVSGVTQLSAGGSNTCITLVDENTVRCIGDNTRGQLNRPRDEYKDRYEDNVKYEKFIDVFSENHEKIFQLSVGLGRVCALHGPNRTLSCWGDNSSGEGVSGHVGSKAFSLGMSSTCAVDLMGRLKCWGNGLYGALGYGNENNYGDDPHETLDQLPYVEFKDATPTATSTPDLEAD